MSDNGVCIGNVSGPIKDFRNPISQIRNHYNAAKKH